jgi:NADH pyrophosphatase NudC (nudix superfamily)
VVGIGFVVSYSRKNHVLIEEELADTKWIYRRRTDNAMAKRKSTKRTNELQNTTHKTKDRVTR